MAFSAVGRTKVAVHLLLLVVNIVVLALSARVNQYQEWFFIADRFPFVLSIITFVLVGIMTLLDFVSNNAFTGRPQFEIGVFSVLSILWLAFNAFSTSRWNAAPFNCGVIPSDFADTIQWCQQLSALRVLVWVEWAVLFLTTVCTLRYAITQSSRGNKHVFQMPLSRYEPNERSMYGGAPEYPFGGNQFMQQYEKN
ncbi:hypothetical protein C8R47DRAFT_1104770 [Mycena vitilis]|nr:hypothetical protein C8R47DRAFT_1104770 [Mycena vitilis]